MSEAGFETEFITSTSASNTGNTVVFSDYYKHEDPVRRGVLMPMNENLFNIGLAQTMDQAYHFYISCRDDLVDEMRKTNINPSCEIRPPWKLPPVPTATSFRPICLFFPSYGNWDEKRCIAMAESVASSMGAETVDLSAMTFILDIAGQPPKSFHQQNIVRASDDGSHLWHMLMSSIFVCMGSPYIAECAFVQHLRQTGMVKAEVFAENLMTNDGSNYVDEMIKACEKADNYTSFKTWCVDSTRIRDSKDVPAFIDLVSPVFGNPVAPSCCISMPAILQALRNDNSGCDPNFLCARQQRAASVFVEKLTLTREYFERYRPREEQGTS